MDLTPEYLALKKEFAKQNKKLSALKKKESAIRTELSRLQEQCTHEELEQKSHYFSGSYYDRAFTEYWNECKLCKARSETTTQSHNWYG